MITALDRWVLRRLQFLSGLNGELAHASDPAVRRLGERVIGLPVDFRRVAVDGFVAAYGDDLLTALAAIDPGATPPDAGDHDQPPPRFRMTCTADVTCRPVEWLWPDRVPSGMLSLFAGDPKLGKSIVTIAMAAAISRGAALPGGPPPDGPGSVVLISAEDDAARTIVPRLKAAGADLARVHILESVYLSDGTEALPSLRTDVDAIEQAAGSLDNCKLIIIDPVSAYLGGTDDHRNAEPRGVLSPLKQVAERTNAAAVLVTHLNKAAGTNGKHRVTGSIAYVGACRSNFLFVRDRSDPTGRRVLMLANGCNLAGDLPTLAYQIADRGTGPAVEWEDAPVSVTVEHALAAESEDPEDRADRDECDAWLRETLATGPVPVVDLMRAGRDAGFTQSAMNRAKRRIGATTERDGFGRGSRCSWTLSAGASTQDPADLDPPIDVT